MNGPDLLTPTEQRCFYDNMVRPVVCDLLPDNLVSLVDEHARSLEPAVYLERRWALEAFYNRVIAYTRHVYDQHVLAPRVPFGE